MEALIPGLRESVLGLTSNLRLIVYFVCVVGLMIQIHGAHANVESIGHSLVRAIIVIGLVATLPMWFGFTEKLFLSGANVIEEGYTEHPMRAATLVRGSIQETNDSPIALRRIGETISRGLLWASAKLIVILGSILQLPFLALQYVLKLLCYLFLPIALGLYMIPSLASLGTRYLQQTLAILAWPIGFAITELVAFHLLTGFQTGLAAQFGMLVPFDPLSMASVVGALLGAIWLIVGTLGTPLVMQMLFCSGSPLTGGGQSALQQLYTIQQVAWMVKSFKTGGAALPAAIAASVGKSGRGGGADMPPPPPSIVAPPPPSAPVAPNAAAVLSRTQLPAPQTTI